jgi:hypothetical protein
MFKKDDGVIDKVLNPFQITKSSMIEFKTGAPLEEGFYTFKKVIEMNVGGRYYTRYLIFSKLENEEFIIEIFMAENDQREIFIYKMVETMPFSEEFLNIVGQRFITTPDNIEYIRTIMPESEEHIDGIAGKAKVYDLQSGKIEREVGIKIWDYCRDNDGVQEFLNIEMIEDTGMFRIFSGEMLQEVFIKLYQGNG